MSIGILQRKHYIRIHFNIFMIESFDPKDYVKHKISYFIIIWTPISKWAVKTDMRGQAEHGLWYSNVKNLKITQKLQETNFMG